jgi:hypothetical protein
MRFINVEVAAPRELSRERELVLVAIEEANQTFRDADLDIRLIPATADPDIVIGVLVAVQHRHSRIDPTWSS